jgi:integrase
MNASPFLVSDPVPVPQSYAEFLDEARRFVASKGMDWRIDLGPDGKPTEGTDWDLRVLTGSHARTASRTNGFAVDRAVREAGIAAGWSAASMPAGEVLDPEVQDFIKAVIARRCQQAHVPRDTRHFARLLRKLFSSTVRRPWELGTEDLGRFLSLEHTGDKVVDATVAVAKLMNENLLSVSCPLQPPLTRSLPVRFAKYLNDRKDDQKLPNKAALYELARIVFQEMPRSHSDAIRFSAIRLLILTGLRLNEVLMLPSDCLRWESHVDIVTGRPAGEIGGVSRTLRLRYFAEKHEEGAPDLLVEEHQWVPSRFQGAVVEAVEMARIATFGLRAVLGKQRLARHDHPRSDLRRFRTTAGTELGTEDLLFLVMFNGSKALPSSILDDEAIAPVSLGAFYQGLRSYRENKGTLFTRYGRTDEAHRMSVNPHSLRHLMNTELFRLRLSDTAITQQFGRRSVAQSHEYDHRSLAERLAFVRLPEAAERVVRKGEPEELIAKMVASGLAANSHIGLSFRAIQREQGDEAAFVYLAANSDGFHITPYGFCTNSFSVNPCARHLKCFDQCKHFTASGLAEHRTSLEELRAKLEVMRAAAASKPPNTVGRRNQIAHADRLVAGVDAALAAQPATQVFPDGPDHSAPDPDLFQ